MTVRLRTRAAAPVEQHNVRLLSDGEPLWVEAHAEAGTDGVTW